MIQGDGAAWAGAELAAAAAGDAFAWDLLVDRVLPDVWEAARDAGLSEHDAAGVCQVVSVRLAQSLHELAADGRVDGYVARVTREECRRATARALRCGQRRNDARDHGEGKAALAGCLT